MSYKRSYTDWFGETRYERVETPDEDYDRMIQEQLDQEGQKEMNRPDDSRYDVNALPTTATLLPIARWKEAGQLAYERVQDDWPAGTLNANMIILAVTDSLANYLTEEERKEWNKTCWAEQKRFVVNNVL